jgi:hypothetical protein
MRGRSGSPTWTRIFAAGLLLRPILIVPMAPSGLLSGSVMLPVGLAAVFAVNLLLAIGAYVGSRLVIALGILTAAAGVPLAAAGAWAGLPSPWPLLLVGYNAALVAAGIAAWRGSMAAAEG